MSLNQPIRDLEKAESIPQGTAYVASMGNGSGVKAVTQEVLTKAVGEGLKIGNPEELQTENKESLVGAINEVAESGGGGGSLDILDTKEEIEANTESGKVAGALGVKEIVAELNNNLNGNILTYNESEDAYYIQHGADAVPKKLGNAGGMALLESGSIDISPGDQAYFITFSKTYKGKKMLIDNSYTGYAPAITETYPYLNDARATLDGEFNRWRIRTNCNIKNTIRWYLFDDLNN
ncbi:MAG: hypothetical protein HDR23_07050 [Lachnospiraceae bacterium]|nr:hypothetical protein [Lachnospiraceae bacterium]